MTLLPEVQMLGRFTPLVRGRRLAAVVALAVLDAAGGCSGELTGLVGAPATASGASPFAGAAATLDPALVGRWRRAVYFTADNGTTNSSETTWTFTADGSALRTVISRNLLFGYSDVVSAAAVWRTEGGTVVIAYRPPDSGRVRFSYAVSRSGAGDVLYLGAQSFARVGF